MIRTIIMLAFWTVAAPFTAVVGFPWTFITGRVDLLYRMSMWAAWTGVRLAGVRVETTGLDRIDSKRSYIFMSNHVSNLDPPLLLPLIPGRTSVMVKKELFSYPILGRAMRIGSLVPVDRGNRDAGIAAVREASAVLRRGISMAIFVEGMRSYDGKLLPFKKGPFFLAMETGVPVIPVTIDGTYHAMPKARFAVKPGIVKIIFHDAIEPKDFGGSREELMERVRNIIAGALSA
jgi:1-acyl-sn-glycerol-3-phosphate acyltransferase